MRRIFPLGGLCLNLCLCLGVAGHASTYDYSYGSMARYNEASRENSFNRYMSSGSANYNIDSEALAKSLKNIFEKPSPPRYSEPSRPTGINNWSEYWKNYRDPNYTYTRPVIEDTRSPQQKLLDSAQGGDINAMSTLAYDYAYGKGGFSVSDSSSVYWYTKAFEAGDKESGWVLFTLFDDGYGTANTTVKKDPIQALAWLQKLAKAGNPNAMNILGARTLQGAGVDKNPVEGIRLLKAALAAGEDGALIHLKYAYQLGTGVQKDLNEALKWQRELTRLDIGMSPKAELVELLLETDDPKNRTHTAEIKSLIDGDPQNLRLQLLHVKLLDSGVLGAPDPAKSVEICQQIVAKNQGFGDENKGLAETQALLANHLYEGTGIAKDEIAAYKLYRKANEAKVAFSDKSGFYFASLITGRLQTRNADGTSTVIDEPKTALPLLFEAQESEALPMPLRAQAALIGARCLAAHPELKREFPEPNIAEQVYRAGVYDTNTRLGIALGCRLGWFGPVDKDISHLMAQRAVDAGIQEALFYLAQWQCEDTEGQNPDWQKNIEAALKNKTWDAYLWMSDQLISGKYLPKDLTRAQELLRVAATEGNNAQAQGNLGVMLWKGTAGDKKVPDGLDWMEKALNNGLWVAGRNLAKIYHLGLDVEKDEAKAKAYLEKAGATGGSESAAVVAAAYEKGDIIAADPQAAERWKALAAK